MTQLQPTQPLDKSVAATSDANGKATFTFESPPASLVWTGSVSIPAALVTSSATATVSGTPWGTWQGPGTFGPIQAGPMAQLQIVALNLLPNTPYQAVWLGTSEDQSTAQIVGPSATPQAVLNYGQIIFSIAKALSIGTPEMLAFGVYVVNDPTIPSWSLQVESGATMLQGDGVTFDLPPDSVAIIALNVDAGSATPTSPQKVGYSIPVTAGGSAIAEQLFEGTAVANFTGLSIGSAAVGVQDSTVTPSFTVGLSSAPTNIAFDAIVTLLIFCFAHP